MSGIGTTHASQNGISSCSKSNGQWMHLEETLDIPDVVFEPQVDHMVCLIHTQELAICKPELLFFQHVNESARCSNDNVKSLV